MLIDLSRFSTDFDTVINTDELIADEDKGREFMLEFDRRMEELNYEIVEASFNFHTNLTAENQAHLVSFLLEKFPW